MGTFSFCFFAKTLFTIFSISGASSLSGDIAVSSSSPDYPPKDEASVLHKKVGELGSSAAPKRKYRMSHGHQGSSKTDSVSLNKFCLLMLCFWV